MRVMDGISPQLVVAMKMFLAKLAAEVRDEPFTFGQLGWTWLSPTDVVCASVDGMNITCSMVVEAAYELLGCSIAAHAARTGVTEDIIITEMALSLAVLDL